MEDRVDIVIIVLIGLLAHCEIVCVVVAVVSELAIVDGVKLAVQVINCWSQEDATARVAATARMQ